MRAKTAAIIAIVGCVSVLTLIMASRLQRGDSAFENRKGVPTDVAEQIGKSHTMLNPVPTRHAVMIRRTRLTPSPRQEGMEIKAEFPAVESLPPELVPYYDAVTNYLARREMSMSETTRLIGGSDSTIEPASTDEDGDDVDRTPPTNAIVLRASALPEILRRDGSPSDPAMLDSYVLIWENDENEEKRLDATFPLKVTPVELARWANTESVGTFVAAESELRAKIGDDLHRKIFSPWIRKYDYDSAVARVVMDKH